VGLVVNRKCDDLNAELVEPFLRALEGPKLGVAVRAPRPAEEQHNGEMAGQDAGQVKGITLDQREGNRREVVAGVEQLHVWTPCGRRMVLAS
jgi:hypothetical protein